MILVYQLLICFVLYKVFMSPEIAVSSRWRNIFSTSFVKKNLVMISIDEAHCIIDWLEWYMIMFVDRVIVKMYIFRGTAFRKTFAMIGGLRASVMSQSWH